MTEREWRETGDCHAMLWWLARRASAQEGRLLGPNRDRKFRLFACACLRLAWQRLPMTSQAAVEFMERYADGGDGAEWYPCSRRTRSRKKPGVEAYNLFWEGRNLPASVCSISAGTEGHGGTAADHLALVRCVFGNPFRPVALAPACRTPTILSLAQATYEERIMPSGELEAARLAVLADALEEAGCDVADLLAHLRAPGPHIRGCWALDLVLNKE